MEFCLKDSIQLEVQIRNNVFNLISIFLIDMKKNIKLFYNPLLSIKENADICNVSLSAIRQFIQRNSIDRKFDNSLIILKKIEEAISCLSNTNEKITNHKLKEITGYSLNTIIKYKKHIFSYCELKSNTENVSIFALNNSRRIIKSVSSNQHDILRDILTLYVPSKMFDCDLTFSVGNFYKNKMTSPLHKYDKYPRLEDVKPLFEIELMRDKVFNSIVVDLPFIISGQDNFQDSSKTNIIHKRFNSFKNAKELYQANDYIIEQSSRLLKKEGVLIMKTMDTVSSGKQIFTSQYVINKCAEYGLELLDTFILIAQTKILSSKITKQQHARKYHSYFFCFKKTSY